MRTEGSTRPPPTTEHSSIRVVMPDWQGDQLPASHTTGGHAAEEHGFVTAGASWVEHGDVLYLALRSGADCVPCMHVTARSCLHDDGPQIDNRSLGYWRTMQAELTPTLHVHKPTVSEE